MENVKTILTGFNWKVGVQDETYTIWKKDVNGEYVLEGEFSTFTEALLGVKRWLLRMYLRGNSGVSKTSDVKELQKKLKMFERWWKVSNPEIISLLEAVSKVESVILPTEKKNGYKRRHKEVR